MLTKAILALFVLDLPFANGVFKVRHVLELRKQKVLLVLCVNNSLLCA